MILFIISILLSLGIAGFGLIQGRRCFGSFEQSASMVRELTGKLETCMEGVSFKEVLGGWLKVDDPTTRNIAHKLSRVFSKKPLRLQGHLGWVVDLNYLCDGKRAAGNHPSWGMAEAMPGLLTGAGVLCTFLGLTIGVYGLDPTNAEILSEGVKKLLSGMSMAFLTSIAGVGASLWWTWRNRITRSIFEASYRELLNMLRDKPFLLIPEEMNYQMLDFQSTQSEALEQMEDTVFKAFSRALTPAMAGLSKSLQQNGDQDQLNTVLEGIRKELAQLARSYAETGEVNRKLNRVISQFAQKKAETVEAVDSVANSEKVVENIGKINMVQSGALEDLKASSDALRKLLQAARMASTEIGQSHQAVAKHLQNMDSHWSSYRKQIESMQESLDKTLAGFGEGMKQSLSKIHGEFDSLLAESLTHFATSLKGMETAIESLSLFMRQDEDQPDNRRNWLGKRKQ